MTNEETALTAVERASLELRERECREGVRLRCLEIARDRLSFLRTGDDPVAAVDEAIVLARRLEAYVVGLADPDRQEDS